MHQLGKQGSLLERPARPSSGHLRPRPLLWVYTFLLSLLHCAMLRCAVLRRVIVHDVNLPINLDALLTAVGAGLHACMAAGAASGF